MYANLDAYENAEPASIVEFNDKQQKLYDEGYMEGYEQALIDYKKGEEMEKSKKEEKVVIKNIYQRINQVMMEVESVQKEDKKVNGQYTFVSHDAVARALHKPMVNAGIVMIPTTKSMVQNGNRTEITMEISFINIDDPTDKVVVEYTGYGIDPQDKGIGKAISYAVKYALLKVFCLETNDDVERDSIEHKPAKLTESQVDLITKLGEKNPEMLHKIMAHYKKQGVLKISEIPAEQYARIVTALTPSTELVSV
ncbi:MAG: ERF family protein [Chlamydiales bacterium]|nr:ERF family protein [Chlamydiales bacterium]